MTAFQSTRFVKTDGPLTKRVTLTPDGSVKSDGSACVMSRGSAHRVHLADVQHLADLIGQLQPNEAIATGTLRPDLPDTVEITTKRRLDEINGAAQPGIIARTGAHIVYRPAQAAFALLDFDVKGMPAAVAERLQDLGGFWPALRTVLPDLASTGRLYRRSTSAGLYRADTGEQIPGSGGVHLFVAVQDGQDIERFLTTLHARCWLAGLGWRMIGAGGQLLERSIVDRMVGAPERLVFEGAPILDPPLAQDQHSRRPVVIEGATLDTIAVCPPLTIVELARFKELRAKEAHRLAPDAAKARDAFISQQSQRLAQRSGISAESAAQVIARQCAGILLPDVVLPFDDKDLAGTRVADVLADPARFEGATLADPLEGVEYGTCCAKIMRRADGAPWIHSFAHGRTIYELKLDSNAVRAALEKAPLDECAATWVRLVLAAHLDDDEAEDLRNLVAGRVGVGKRALDRKLKSARAAHGRQRSDEERNRRAAERRDPRPQIPAPDRNAEWLPQMQILNDVLGASRALEPPMRDIDGVATAMRVRRVPNMHALTAAGANEGEPEDARLPPPEQPLLTRLDEPHLAELIEQHVQYVDYTGAPVHLAGPFVHHFHKRMDDALPIVVAVATLPIVLPDATLLARCGLDRDRGIVFRIPPELMALLPAREDCDDAAVLEAFRFLHDEWLVDVATDYTGKCILIAAALTLIERSLLPDRPVFFVTAGRRGGGKTTTLIMLLMAITGVRPAAAAWSPNEEERRKALLAYLMEALPAIIWDNIPRGTQISCPHIERSCTSAFYSDRRLGVSELVAVAAGVVHLFTGNNIGPRGDLASRSLTVRLEVERSDPENRPFKHSDPIEWTEAQRGKILAALYTILLGNPNLGARQTTAPKTRFKLWWRLIGSAIEHAVALSGGSLDFRVLFLSQEEDEEESASLADALIALAEKWPNGTEFPAADVARMANDQSEYAPDAERQRNVTVREEVAGQIRTAR